MEPAWPTLASVPPPPPHAHLTVMARGAVDPMQHAVCRAFEDAMADRTTLPKEAFLIQGFSGRKFRTFLNHLIGNLPDPRYLEIGLFHGASFCPAIAGHAVVAVGVDNWSEYGGKAETFTAHLAAHRGETADIRILDQDFRTVDYAALGRFNVLFYDGSHAERDQYDGVRLPLPALDPVFVLIVDDWNLSHVRRGTHNALRDAEAVIGYAIEVRTSFDDKLPLVNGPRSEWHNGCLIAVVTKSV